MQRRSFLKAGGAIAVATGLGTGSLWGHVPTHNTRPPKHIRFNGQVIQAEALVPECLITLPEYKEPASLEILW